MIKQQHTTSALIAGLMFFSSFSYSQRGNEWLVGIYSQAKIKFNTDSFEIKPQFFNTSYITEKNISNICSENGRLLLSTNSGQVADSLSQKILNGDSLVDSLFYGFGVNYIFPSLQGSVVLPKKDNTFYIFSLSVSDKLWATGREQPDQLFYAVVDMNANNGKGAVISKLNLLYNDTLCDGHLTAVRHGNGRDWWVVNNGYENNVLHKYLVTPDTILGPFLQAIGTPRLEPDAVGMACFSKDGSKFAIGTGNSLINVFDFDRCTGMFSNVKTFQSITESPWVNPYPNNSGCNGLSFSPNNRFLYVNSIYTIHQYDLTASDIRATGKLLAKYDNTFSTQSLPFEASYITPVDKIIIGNWDGGNKRMHIIHQPNEAAPNCNFERDGIFIPFTLGASCLPNMPNYDLGALLGCDTFYTIPSKVNEPLANAWRVFPNPTQTKLYLETNSVLTASVTVYDAMGKLVWQQTESHGNVNIDVQTWQAGLYVLVLKTSNAISTKKFLKE